MSFCCTKKNKLKVLLLQPECIQVTKVATAMLDINIINTTPVRVCKSLSENEVGMSCLNFEYQDRNMWIGTGDQVLRVQVYDNDNFNLLPQVYDR